MLEIYLSFLDLLYLLKNTFDRKRISANPSPSPNSNTNPNTNPNSNPGFFLAKRETAQKFKFLVENVMHKKRSATMQHSARTLFHITYTILSHKQTKILLHKFKKGTAQIRGGTAQINCAVPYA